MKIEKTITIPATAARTSSKVVHLCDDCKKEITAYVCRCEECGAELCYKCATRHPEDVGGDNEDSICKSCMEVFRQYLPEIEELEDRLDVLKDARREDCQKKRKKKNEANKTKLPDTN
jgi:hypothetical protein